MVVILGCSGKCVVVNWRPLLRIRSREFDVLVVRTRRRVKRLARALVVVALRAELIAVAWLAPRHDDLDAGAESCCEESTWWQCLDRRELEGAQPCYEENTCWRS